MSARQYLLVRSQQRENTYGPFTGEILKAEGLMGFETVDLDSAPMPQFEPLDLVMLTRCFLWNSEIDMLYDAVEAGTRLVCLQPSPRLAERFGWESQSRVLHPGWVTIRAGYPGSGAPIQAHVPIGVFKPVASADVSSYIADAMCADWSCGNIPAATCQDVGKGKVALFFYDLPKAVARIRFGNPDLASLSAAGHWEMIHAFNLFIDHLDGRVSHLPQADFHCQLLAKVLTDICAYPLPRFWYYEEAQHGTAAVFQSDDDGSTPEQFQELSEALIQRGGTATFYLMEDTKLSDEQVQDLRAKGHTFGPHVNAASSGEDFRLGLPAQLVKETQLFRDRYGEMSSTIQSHCAPWYGYMDWVPLHIENGFRLLFAFIGNTMNLFNRYMCGSGRPMKFFDVDGTLYDCWQQPLVTMDDGSIKERISNNYPQLIKQFASLLRNALEKSHTAISILSHPVSFSTYSKVFMAPAFELLAQANVPIYNGDEWCEFLDRRDAVRIQHSIGENSEMCYTVSNLAGRLPLMLPITPAEDKMPEVLVDGVRAEGVLHRRLEQDYLFVPLEAAESGEEIAVVVRE